MTKKIGIIGGAGPMASCQLYKEIINECQQTYNCTNDNDFPEIIIINYPFSNMLYEYQETDRKQLTTELQACFDKLAKGKVDIAAIACNTLHAFLDDVIISVPKFVHIVRATITYAQTLNLNRLFILGTETTIQANLYKQGMTTCITPTPEDNVIVNAIIQNILKGNITKSDAVQLESLVSAYFQKTPFDAVVLGCTELPLLNTVFPLNITDIHRGTLPVLDTIKILAKTLVKKAFTQ